MNATAACPDLRPSALAAILTTCADGANRGVMNRHLLGSWAVDFLVDRIIHGDFGVPANPRIEMVEREWVDGKTLRVQSAIP